MNNYLIIDLGTGSGRAIIFDDEGNQIALSQQEWIHKNFHNVPGAIDFDTKENWEIVKKLIKDVLKKSNIDKESLKAISSSSMREGIVLYDKEGSEIWSCSNVDARAQKEVEELRQITSDKEMYNKTGQTYSLADGPRILWLKNNLPEIYNKAVSMTMISDWVLYKLSGNFCVEPSNASTSGLFDTFNRKWSHEIFEKMNLNDLMTDVYEPGDVLGTVKKELTEELNLSEKTKVIVGGGDVQLGTLGVGSIKEGDAVILGGTFWQQVVNVKTPVPEKDAKVRINAHVLKDLFQYEGIAFQIGLVARWVRDSLFIREKEFAEKMGVSTYSLMTEMSKSVPAGSHGIVPIFSDVMNYLHWKHASPSFMNIDINDPKKYSRAAIFKSVMENAAFVSKGNLELIKEASGVFPKEVIFAGGASYSDEWSRILANVLGIPVKVPKIKEASSLGALSLCIKTINDEKNIEDVIDGITGIESIHYPNKNLYSFYEENYIKWKKIYKNILTLSDEGLLNYMWKAPGE
jgi:autoinducer 2 (AI-2) kinase